MRYRFVSAAALVNWSSRVSPRTLGSKKSIINPTKFAIECEGLAGTTHFSTNEKHNVDIHEGTSTAITPRVYLALSDKEDFSGIEQEISSRYEIPILSPSQLLEDDATITYTHCIHVLPYDYSSLQTYAIGIEPLANVPSKERRNRKRKNSKTGQMQPIFIDFCPPLGSKMARRVGDKKQGGELLLKAVAPGKYGNDDSGGAIVIDLTAGFGGDSQILASGMTAQVHMVERDPTVALLLSDAMRRLHLIGDTFEDDIRCKTLARKLSLSQDNAINYCQTRRRSDLENISESPDDENLRPHVCYLDPMFPPRRKSAAVKKNMQVLHGLLKTNEKSCDDQQRLQEERDLLNEALKLSKSRVVVKRPINAPPLGSSDDEGEDVRLPSFNLKGSMNRFDVYMV